VGRGRLLEAAEEVPYAQLLAHWRAEYSAVVGAATPSDPTLVGHPTPQAQPGLGMRLASLYTQLAGLPSQAVVGGETQRVLSLLLRLTAQAHLVTKADSLGAEVARAELLREAAHGAVVACKPHTVHLQGISRPVALGMPSLDVSTYAMAAPAALMAAPGLDLDPQVVLSRWATEITTTRQSDYAAKFWVM
jgi:imidazolonepropionase-like amidohydrolase